MSTDQAETDRLEREGRNDPTPRATRVRVSSFEDECRDAWHRVEKKLDGIVDGAGRTRGDVLVLAERVKALTEWRDEQKANTNSGRVVIYTAIAGPAVLIILHLITLHTSGVHP